ncbi:MAG: TonB-dependent receptor [Porticoccaceae bacterium]|nr:TonB-dependent receptor [Porticoccaceae bacterium]
MNTFTPATPVKTSLASAVRMALAVSVVTVCPAVMADPAIDEEVIVSASHLPIPQSQTANAVTVIDAEMLKNRSPLAISDILRDVPGLAVSRTSMLGSATQIRARGAEGNHLLVLIDGVEANDPSQSDELNWGTLTAADIERIEVIRGPMSALYGSDAVAGVISITTKRADKPFSASVFSEVGTLDTRNNGVSVGHKGEAFNIRAGVTDLDSSGDNIAATGTEDDGYRNRTYSLNGGWQPLDDLKLSFAARRTEGRNEFDSTDFVVTGLPVDADVFSEFDNDTGRLQLDYAALDGAWLHKLVYARTNNDNDNFNNRLITGSTSSEKDQYQYLTSLLWNQGAQRLSLLLEHENEDFHQRGDISFGNDPNQDRSRESDSAALEYRGTFRDALTLASSIRYDDNSEFDDATTYRLEAIYQLNGDSRVRAAWGAAVKNPTFTERFGYYATSTFPYIGNPNLEPEESQSWELGFDQSLFEGRVELSATWFEAELEDEINGFFFDPTLSATTAVNIDGDSHREGVELGVVAALTETLSLNGSYTYTDSTQEDSVTGRDVDELRRARHIGSLTLAWQALDILQLNANVQYNGTQKDQFFPPWPLPSEIVELDEYTLVNLNATLNATANLDCYVRLENLLDEDYEEVFGFQTPGLGAHLGVRYNFAP